jgi:RNA-directed DNA polymerase
MNRNDESKTKPVSQPAAVAATPTQAGATRDPWSWVERSVWTERMLSRLGSTEAQAKVWFSLMDKVSAPANLQSAFAAVWRNQGSAGVDGQTVGQFETHAEAELARLAEQLRDDTYRPHPARRVWIPKPGSQEQRPLGIPAVRDRVVQSALRHVMEPIFETEFAEHSYGFRPGRGCKDALRRVDALLQSGHVWVVDADLKSYFDTIPHDRLMALVKERIADGRVLALVESYLRAGVLEELKGWQPTGRGTPQGAVISPLLANLYLNPLDQLMAQSGGAMVRYADDFVILCGTEAEAHTALAQVRAWVAEAGLTLHPTKTRIVDASAPGGFDFLGYHFERGMKWPRAKSLGKLRERVRAKTRRMAGCSLKEIIRDVNRSLRGWYPYFQHSKATTFASVDGWIRMRLRSLLRWRQGKKGRGRGQDHQRWTNRWFARQGLFSLENAHEFTVTVLRLSTH